LNFVKAVAAAPEDLKREVELGTRKLAEHRHAPLPTRLPSRRVLLRLLAGLRSAVLRRFGLRGVV
jgi:hypothetical protein